VVVLTAELEVAQHDGDLGARHDQDQEHQRQEAEQVVELQGSWRSARGKVRTVLVVCDVPAPLVLTPKLSWTRITLLTAGRPKSANGDSLL
jgi:hypothetical protein